MKRLPAPPGARASDAPAGTGRPARKRSTLLRPDLRAAQALEYAGELREAARILEYAGEYADAGLLRLELARTLSDPQQRLDVLREGCARQSGTDDPCLELYEAFATALLAEAESTQDRGARRGAHLEAARALEQAGQAGEAGELYEALGLLHRAAATYERGGEVTRLEAVLAQLEHDERRATQLRTLTQDIDDALRDGRRAQAHVLLRDHLGSLEPSERGAQPELVGRLHRLEDTLRRGDRLDVRWGPGQVTSVRGTPTLTVGRGPDNTLSLSALDLSRRHVELRLDASGDHTRVVLVDQGSRTGSFWHGEALEPGVPMVVDDSGQLGLGTRTALQITPIIGADQHHRGAVVRIPGDARHHVYLPQGGPLNLSADIVLPAQILFDHDYIVLDLAAGIRAQLGDHPLPPGAAIELLTHDRVTLCDVPLILEVLP